METFLRKYRLPLTWVLVAACLPVILFTNPRWPETSPIDQVPDTLGDIFLGVGVLGRIWCLTYIAGRKNKALMTAGPYSICRNSLYLFTIFVVAGILCLCANILLIVPVGIVLVLIYVGTVRTEEKNLAARFGETYEEYKRTAPRLWPSLKCYRAVSANGDPISLGPKFLVGLVSSGLFLLAIPIAELVEELHATGVLPVYFHV